MGRSRAAFIRCAKLRASVRAVQRLPSPSRERLLAVLLALAAFGLYAPSFGGGFLWDDDTFLTRNPLIHAADGLRRLWFTREAPDYFPLTSSMLWLEWRLFGEHALGYRVVNAALHAAGAVLVWRVLVRLGVRGAFGGALLFAVHPVCVESVAWITERKNTLSFALCAAAALAYLRSEDEPDSRRMRWSALALFTLALLAKTSAVVLPPILVLCAWWRRGRVGAAEVRRLAPLFGLALVLGAVTVWFQSTVAIRETVVRDDGLVSRVLLAGRAVWFYLGKALAPLELAFVYPRWKLGETSADAVLPAALLAMALAVLWLQRASWGRGAFFALATFVLALAPTLGLLDVYFMRYSLVADHWQHFALPSATAFVAAAASVACERVRVPRLAELLLVLTTFAAGVASVQRQRAFTSEEALWQDTLARNSQAWIAHNELGLLRHDQGRLEEASVHLSDAVRVAPEQADLRFNLGVTLQRLRRHAEAVAQFDMALQLDPRSAAAHNALGSSQLALGRREQALESYRAALALDPKLVAAHNNLGNACYALGRVEEALGHYEAALALKPEHLEALSNSGSALQELGRLEEALARHERVVQLDPRRAPAHFNLGNALRELGRADQARRAYERALELDPKLEGARFFLGELQRDAGRPPAERASSR